ncbi:MAG: Pyridoxamine 5'-phosphate oxidase-related FMN-binding protein [uncultured Thiotrichaceae bacterium]|uniref:Pyridoxamine 5'-phosphate oxidase-related FMN-binding protein n=1 Tax=uncultured Thiotrichaceae bacterium TaxID=298394 RepID=A0A6S6TVV0_9GAMM|nr:MAG: Pyridoxamine 5'-phosphate oxidase-related FMN-binding protein [uncultured Thiotrichaceae bacterium]
MMSPEEQLQELIIEQKSLQIASLTSEGLPYASYAPYIYHNGCFYIYISELAKHTQNLIDDKRISILIIEDEEKSRQVFARRRLSGEGYVSEIERVEEDYTKIIAEFAGKFGNIMNILSNLSDFRLFRVEINAGSFVIGFGKAYTYSGGNVTNLVQQKVK